MPAVHIIIIICIRLNLERYGREGSKGSCSRGEDTKGQEKCQSGVASTDCAAGCHYLKMMLSLLLYSEILVGDDIIYLVD
jgi:hypothetical protein